MVETADKLSRAPSAEGLLQRLPCDLPTQKLCIKKYEEGVHFDSGRGDISQKFSILDSSMTELSTGLWVFSTRKKRTG